MRLKPFRTFGQPRVVFVVIDYEAIREKAEWRGDPRRAPDRTEMWFFDTRAGAELFARSLSDYDIGFRLLPAWTLFNRRTED